MVHRTPTTPTPSSTGRKTAPRLNVELTEAQAVALSAYIPPGQRKYVFQAIVDDLISKLSQEANRNRLLSLIINRQVSITQSLLDAESKEG